MMTVEMQNLLVRLKALLPSGSQAIFAQRLSQQLAHIDMDPMLGYTVAGAFCGTLCELLPLDTITGVDDWVEVGATMGAAIGYARSARERRLKQQILDIVDKEVRHAFGE